MTRVLGGWQRGMERGNKREERKEEGGEGRGGQDWEPKSSLHRRLLLDFHADRAQTLVSYVNC